MTKRSAVSALCLGEERHTPLAVKVQGQGAGDYGKTFDHNRILYGNTVYVDACYETYEHPPCMNKDKKEGG